MNSTTDTAGHPDVEEISDLTEGLLPPSRTEDIRRHLEECDLCAEVHASLEEIRGFLGTLPEPARMPADVADRIDAALTAEAAVTRVSRETPAPADRPAGRPQAATGPGRKDHGRGRRRRTVVLGAVLTAAVLGAGSLFLQSLGNDSHSTAQDRQTTSAGTFSGSDLRSQVDGLLAAKKSSPHGSESAKTLMQPSVPVPDCVRDGIHSNGDVLGAKTGTYEGKDAFLVVVSDTSDPTRVTAYVVDAACVSRQPAPTGKVLAKQSLARP
ncbi:hypothetical protein ABZX30_06425 [Streptomyces sp. NPDC004542]|uniref:anti-sigma factor family protein n=1 Tax=Streptomyces sp. NPDC004542 TaxID=3154281 RepID=UPI0033B62BAA